MGRITSSGGADSRDVGLTTPHSIGAIASDPARRSRAHAAVSGQASAANCPSLLPAIGGHGAEIRPSPHDGPETEHAHALDGGLRNRLAELAVGAPGVLVEDKGYSFAVHYRLAPEQEGRVKEAVAAIRADWPQEP